MKNIKRSEQNIKFEITNKKQSSAHKTLFAKNWRKLQKSAEKLLFASTRPKKGCTTTLNIFESK